MDFMVDLISFGRHDSYGNSSRKRWDEILRGLLKHLLPVHFVFYENNTCDYKITMREFYDMDKKMTWSNGFLYEFVTWRSIQMV